MAGESDLAEEIQIILRENANVRYDSSKNKVKCSLTGHEMPCKVDIIQMYLNGKKFKKFKDKEDRIFQKYQPHIVPKEGHKNQLYCLLTKKTINRSEEQVEHHVNGAKYKKALAQWETKKRVENNNATEEETCVIEEDEEEEEDDELENNDDDLDDLYPDIDQDQRDIDDKDENIGDDDDDDSDDDEEENSPVKNKQYSVDTKAHRQRPRKKMKLK